METSTQNLIVLKELAGNPPVQLDPVQLWLAPHIGLIHDFWIAVWCITVIVVLSKVIREHIEHRNKNR